MKGIINKGIQDMVIALKDEETWEKVKEKAQCQEDFFALTNDYPDELTIALAEAVSEVFDMPLDKVLEEYGRFVVPNTLKEYYDVYFTMAGSNAREFLLNMGTVHSQATNSIPNANPPRFEYEELPDGSIRMHYFSKRNLCKVLKGLIRGVGDYFNESLEVTEIACVLNGDDHCIMEVKFN